MNARDAVFPLGSWLGPCFLIDLLQSSDDFGENISRFKKGFAKIVVLRPQPYPDGHRGLRTFYAPKAQEKGSVFDWIGLGWHLLYEEHHISEP